MGEIRQSLKVKGLKGGMRLDALFDSGATTNYIKESIAKKIGLADLGEVEFEVADGRILKGYISSVLVFIRTRYAETEVIVSPVLKEQLILGQSFMQENDLLLNFKNDKVRFGITQPKTKKIYRL